MEETSQKQTVEFFVEDSALDLLLADQSLFNFECRNFLRRGMSDIFTDAIDTLHSIHGIVEDDDLLEWQKDRFIAASARMAAARRQATRVVNGVADSLSPDARVYLASAFRWIEADLVGNVNLEILPELRATVRQVVLELLDGLTFNEAFTDFRLGPSMLANIVYDFIKALPSTFDEAMKAQEFAYLLLTERDDACPDVGLTLRGAIETFS